MQLLQTHTQTSQSIQAQFSCLQSQQNRILELLVPLHPILQSVPLHIDVARNAIIEKIPEGCQCAKPCPGPTLSVSMAPPSGPEMEQSLVPRKRRRISIESSRSGPHSPTPWSCLDLDQHLETHRHQMPQKPVEKTVETQNPILDRRTTTGLSSVQTPSTRKNGSSGSDLTMTATSGSSYPESVTVRPGSGNAVLATTRLPAIVRGPTPNQTVGGKGIATPPIRVFPHTKRAKDNPISYTRVSRLVHIEVCRSHLCLCTAACCPRQEVYIIR
jgi:hypothetical protein